jgi:hypothetical protein
LAWQEMDREFIKFYKEEGRGEENVLEKMHKEVKSLAKSMH